VYICKYVRVCVCLCVYVCVCACVCILTYMYIWSPASCNQSDVRFFSAMKHFAEAEVDHLHFPVLKENIFW
jgi:hypothetical protein